MPSPDVADQGSVPERRRASASTAALLVLGTITVTVGALGGVVSNASPGDTYLVADRPPLAPPDAAFGPVWAVLFGLNLLAAFRVWRRGATLIPLALWVTQLGLNLLWVILFFGQGLLGWALAEIVILLAAVAATAGAFWKVDRLAGALLLPYAAWLAFATYLTSGIFALN